MNRLFEAYRAFHEQCFIPIFVEDGRNPKVLVEGCVRAGMKGVEYTLRRQDAREMIPWIRRNFPDLFLFVGSTLDDERIVRQMRHKHPQLMTIEEIAQLDVDGFISMIGWRQETIARYAATHVIATTASTITEALQTIGAGAHFAKMLGSDLDFVKRCRSDAAFEFCPIFVTGGMTTERIPFAIEAGAITVAAGFDLTLKELDVDADSTAMAAALKPYLDVAQQSRNHLWPQIKIGASRKEWLDSLPHYHPFDKD